MQITKNALLSKKKSLQIQIPSKTRYRNLMDGWQPRQETHALPDHGSRLLASLSETPGPESHSLKHSSSMACNASGLKKRVRFGSQAQCYLANTIAALAHHATRRRRAPFKRMRTNINQFHKQHQVCEVPNGRTVTVTHILLGL